MFPKITVPGGKRRESITFVDTLCRRHLVTPAPWVCSK